MQPVEQRGLNEELVCLLSISRGVDGKYNFMKEMLCVRKCSRYSISTKPSMLHSCRLVSEWVGFN